MCPNLHFVVLATQFAWFNQVSCVAAFTSTATVNLPRQVCQQHQRRVDGNAHTLPAHKYKPCVRPKNAVLSSPKDDTERNDIESPIQVLIDTVTKNPSNSIQFSLLMAMCGASLGPFLDSYHSLFGVLSYDTPLVFPLLGSIGESQPLLTCVTTYWVPLLFGLAGFLIGWLYIWFDAVKLGRDAQLDAESDELNPSIPKVLVGISYFTFQYWLSGICYAHGLDRATILALMSILAAGGFIALDGTISGLITSLATAIGGPLIEIFLISILPVPWGYHYNDFGETGFFPLWIVPVYFLGGPANGNLARLFWNSLNENEFDGIAPNESSQKQVQCEECQGTRLVSCPNCDDGTYVTYNRRVVCNACRGKGVVICRRCFNQYEDDPNDIESIRKLVDRLYETRVAELDETNIFQ
ncbi:hypothetical protein ACHAWO_008918 [Cyclotella atomus]|uniref:Derlin n=1 Tax=Cyclotella atomus TaxID=382360 RepID=A0ABD3QGZ1_9STRA